MTEPRECGGGGGGGGGGEVRERCFFQTSQRILVESLATTRDPLLTTHDPLASTRDPLEMSRVSLSDLTCIPQATSCDAIAISSVSPSDSF